MPNVSNRNQIQLPITGVKNTNQYVFQFLSHKDLQNLRETCKELKEEVDDLPVQYQTGTGELKEGKLSDYFGHHSLFKNTRTKIEGKKLQLEDVKNPEACISTDRFWKIGAASGATVGLGVGISLPASGLLGGIAGYVMIPALAMVGIVLGVCGGTAVNCCRLKYCTSEQTIESRLEELEEEMKEAPKANFMVK